MSDMGASIRLNQGLDCSGTIFCALQMLSSGEASLFACVLWNIQKQRNSRVWKETVNAQCYVLERATSLLFDGTILF